MDQSEGISISRLRVAFGDASSISTSHAENGSVSRHCRVVFLPILLLRVLRDRALRGSELPIFGAFVSCSLSGSEKTIIRSHGTLRHFPAIIRWPRPAANLISHHWTLNPALPRLRAHSQDRLCYCVC